MSEIKKLLEVDAENAVKTEQFFAGYNPELPEALEEGAQLFRTFSRVYSQGAKDDEDHRILASYSERLTSLEPEGLRSILRSPLPKDPKRAKAVRAAREAANRWMSRRARGVLLILAFRCYMFAVTDLLRLRISVAYGHFRVQIETVALMRIMVHEPSVALDWIELGADHQKGKTFFRKYSKKVRVFIDNFGLETVWNLASGTAQHARFASVVYGLSQDTFEECGRKVDRYEVMFQEVQKDNPFDLILRTSFLLLMQYQIFLALREALPEVDDPILLETRLPKFRSRVRRIWASMEKAYPEEVSRLMEKLTSDRKFSVD